MAKKNEKEVMDQLFEEMKNGNVKNYDEMMKRKAELFNVSKENLGEVQENNKSSIYLPKIIIVILIIAAIVLYNVLGRNPISQESYNGLKAMDDPTQTETIVGEFIEEYGDIDWTIKPRADYKLVSKVQSKHHMFSWQDTYSSISQYDLALAWGDLVDPQYDKYISYRQTGRVYKYSIKDDCPLSKSYISTHSANTHIIAATDNVLNGIKNVKEGDIIYMEGYLVDISGKKESYNYEWKTSLVRNDTSFDAGCEVFYVAKIQVGDMTYE